ncbi:MAG: tetratricopeptide (TPR) repeat protein [Arenicella sp.]|jgi:tetratricopeptide (TPR) repeat protein
MKNTILFLLLFIGASGLTQDFKKQLKQADKLFKSELYVEALDQYQKLLTIKPQDSDLAYKYGACVVMTNSNNEQALKYLLVAEKKGKSDKEIAFFVGKAYENQKDYKNAITYYERFQTVADRSQLKKLKVSKSIKSCKKMLK